MIIIYAVDYGTLGWFDELNRRTIPLCYIDNINTFSFLCPRNYRLRVGGGGHINLPLSIRPSVYRYMVCPAISSYSFGATALVFVGCLYT